MVPTRIGGQERRLPIGIRQLPPAKREATQRFCVTARTHLGRLAAGINATMIGMPDLDIRIFDRPAVGGMHDPDGHAHRQANVAFRHVLTLGNVVDVTGSNRPPKITILLFIRSFPTLAANPVRPGTTNPVKSCPW